MTVSYFTGGKMVFRSFLLLTSVQPFAAFRRGLVERADVELSVVGKLGCGVGLIDVETEVRARTSRAPLEIAVRVAEGGDGRRPM